MKIGLMRARLQRYAKSKPLASRPDKPAQAGVLRQELRRPGATQPEVEAASHRRNAVVGRGLQQRRVEKKRPTALHARDGRLQVGTVATRRCRSVGVVPVETPFGEISGQVGLPVASVSG